MYNFKQARSWGFCLALVPQGVLVKQVLCHLVGVGIHAGEVGDVVAQLLDGLHLLVQVMGLQEVTQLRTRSKNKILDLVKGKYL